jgi:hypothetical protein
MKFSTEDVRDFSKFLEHSNSAARLKGLLTTPKALDLRWLIYNINHVYLSYSMYIYHKKSHAEDVKKKETKFYNLLLIKYSENINAAVKTMIEEGNYRTYVISDVFTSKLLVPWYESQIRPRLILAGIISSSSPSPTYDTYTLKQQREKHIRFIEHYGGNIETISASKPDPAALLQRFQDVFGSTVQGDLLSKDATLLNGENAQSNQ